MLKRILIATTVALATHSGAVFADNNWSFDDAFWSRDRGMQRVEHTIYDPNQVNGAFQKYQQVDGYNS